PKELASSSFTLHKPDLNAGKRLRLLAVYRYTLNQYPPAGSIAQKHCDQRAHLLSARIPRGVSDRGLTRLPICFRIARQGILHRSDELLRGAVNTESRGAQVFIKRRNNHRLAGGK